MRDQSMTGSFLAQCIGTIRQNRHWTQIACTPKVRSLPLLLSVITAFMAVALTSHSASAEDAKPGLLFSSQRVLVKDGAGLEICIAKPSNARPGQRFPVLLTEDGYATPCDSFGHEWYEDYVKAGYVVAYLHARGTGASEGVMPDREYSPDELNDAYEVVGWLAKQDWSNGQIGMFGTSWSGITALLTAAKRPPALKAIITFMATENIYSEDVRYPDKIMHVDDYTVAADVMLLSPPAGTDPFDESILRQRFDQQPMSLTFLRQQRDGDFWFRNLRRDNNPDAGAVPTMMVGAWHDPYRNAVLRALEQSGGPVSAVIGPWNHSATFPGPKAELARISIDWWDYFLKGKKNGVLERPQVTVFMRRPYRPIITRAEIPGEWRSIARWRDAPIESQVFRLTESRMLSAIAGQSANHQLRMVATTGVSAGLGWIDVAPDQREGDATALTFDSGPLAEELQILGRPQATLISSVDVDQANWFVKLSDVAPDGTVTLITGGALNGAYRGSPSEPEKLEPNEKYTLNLPLHFTSWIFQRGHRIRISVSNALFPAYWPSAKPVLMSLAVGENGSALSLPVIAPQAQAEAKLAAESVGSRNLSIEEAEESGSGRAETTWNGPVRSQIIRDDIARTTTLVRGFQWADPEGEDVAVEFTVSDDDPARAKFSGRASFKSKWQGVDVEWRGTTEITSDETAFNYRHVRQLLRGDEVVREREWKERVPRDFQ